MLLGQDLLGMNAAGPGRGEVFPYSKGKTLKFLFGWFYLVLPSFSFTLDPLLFFQKGKLRQRTRWLAISVSRKERWWREWHSEFGVKRPQFKICFSAP